MPKWSEIRDDIIAQSMQFADFGFLRAQEVSALVLSNPPAAFWQAGLNREGSAYAEGILVGAERAVAFEAKPTSFTANAFSLSDLGLVRVFASSTQGMPFTGQFERLNLYLSIAPKDIELRYSAVSMYERHRLLSVATRLQRALSRKVQRAKQDASD